MFRPFRADTDQLQTITQSFLMCAGNVEATLQEFSECLEALRVAHWHDAGAERFFAEMDELILPQLRALHHFLNTCYQQTTEVLDHLTAAEPGFKELERQIAALAAMKEKLSASTQRMSALAASLQSTAAPDDLPPDDHIQG